jgi:hypothetical protein
LLKHAVTKDRLVSATSAASLRPAPKGQTLAGSEGNNTSLNPLAMLIQIW